MARASAGADDTTELWQVQLVGPNARCFNFKILAVMREAVLEHPNQKVRAVQDVEKVLGVRVVLGAPAQVGKSDPDDVGFVDWQLVIYSCGLPCVLDFIRFILDYKVRKGIEIASMPPMAVYMVDKSRGLPSSSLPSPWFQLKDTCIEMPKPFAALPPKGRRHVLMQLDILRRGTRSIEDNLIIASDANEEEGGLEEGRAQPEGTYALTFFGNIFPFKDRFDAQGIPLSLTTTDAAGQMSYTRSLGLRMDAPSKLKVLEVLVDVLKGLPLYFINMTSEDDPMARWLLQQPTVAQAESAGEP